MTNSDWRLETCANCSKKTYMWVSYADYFFCMECRFERPKRGKLKDLIEEGEEQMRKQIADDPLCMFRVTSYLPKGENND